jgi:hypothetical protein
MMEVIPMAMNRTKWFTAAVLVACGLAAGIGPVVISNADAQAPQPGNPLFGGGSGKSATAPPGGTGGGSTLGGEKLGGGLSGANPLQPGGFTYGQGSSSGGSVARTQWEYKFVTNWLSAKDAVKLFTDMGNDGWEFCGYYEFNKDQLPAAVEAYPDKIVVKPGSSTALVFKRQKGGARVFGGGGTSGFPTPGGVGGSGFGLPGGGGFPAPGGPGGGVPPGPGLPAPGGSGGGSGGRPPAPAGTEKFSTSTTEKSIHVLPLKNSNAEETAAMLQKVFGSSLSVTPETRTNSLIIRADAETLAEVKKLLDKVEALDGGVPSPRKK